MATVYLLVVSRLDDHHPIHEATIEVRTRAFVTPEIRAVAARRLIDEAIARFNPRSLPPEACVQALDDLDDMLFARKQGDLSYELLCCRSVFGLGVEFQDVAMELEELIGEVLN